MRLVALFELLAQVEDGLARLVVVEDAGLRRREYKEAIASFRSMLAARPEHPKAPEAMLAIANCQVELKDTKGARKTIGELVQAYPKSEAAQAGRERLAALK